MGFDNEHAHWRPEMPFVVFDLETVPMPGCESFLDMDAIKAPSNYKDPDKIAAYIEDAKRKEIERAGLDIDLCEIACIGWEDHAGAGGLVPRNLFSETEMLKKFWVSCGSHQLVGFNIWHFDLPVLVRRSLYLGVPVPADLRLEGYRPDARVLDVAHALSFGRRDLLHSLDFYCKRFGIDHGDSVTGADIARLVAEGNWKAVTAHCYADVYATRQLALRIGMIRAAVAA